MSNSRDRGPELDYFELRRRHEAYKNRAHSDKAPAVKPIEKRARREEIEPEFVGEREVNARSAIRKPVLFEEEAAFEADALRAAPAEKGSAKPVDAADEYYEESEEEYEDYEDDYAEEGEAVLEDNPNPFDPFLRFFKGVKDKRADKRGGDSEPTEDGDYIDEEELEDDDFEEDAAPRKSGFKKFLNLFVAHVDEEEEDDEYDDEDYSDEDDDWYDADEGEEAEDGFVAAIEEEIVPVVEASTVAEATATVGMSRRERRELAKRLAEEESAAVEAPAEEAVAEETPVSEEKAEIVCEVIEEKQEVAEVTEESEGAVQEPTREFKPVSVREAAPVEDLFDVDGDEDDDEDEEEEEKPRRRGLFGRRRARRIEEEEDDEDDFDFEDEDDEDEDEFATEIEDEGEDDEEEEKPRRRGLFGRRRKVRYEEDDEDGYDEDDEYDDDEVADEYEDDFDDEDDEDYDEEDEYDDDDEYDDFDDDDDRRSFGHHLIGFFKVILAIALILLIAAITLNFMYIGGHGGIVDTLHEKLGDSGMFSFVFPAYKVRESMPVEAIEEEVLPEPTEMIILEVTPTPTPEATVSLPNFDTDSVGGEATVVEESVAEAAESIG